jgi:hypothetical protein
MQTDRADSICAESAALCAQLDSHVPSSELIKVSLCSCGSARIPNMRMPRTLGIDLLENDLLRRLDRADFARIARDLVEVEIDRDHVLYNPGDPVETVYFPCGTSVASFVLSLDDGREVDTLAVGPRGCRRGYRKSGPTACLFPNNCSARREVCHAGGNKTCSRQAALCGDARTIYSVCRWRV